MSPIWRHALPLKQLSQQKRQLSLDIPLYLVANRPSFSNEDLFFAKIQDAVRGGVSCVQLRDYQNDLPSTIRTALHIRKMLQDIPLFINTLHTLEVAKAVHAEGIYLEDNISFLEARKSLGENAIIGVPVKTMNEVMAFEKTHEVDYLSVKVAPSKKTCPRNDQVWGVDGLRSIVKRSPHRIVAIGGLTLSCVEVIFRELRDGDGVAMAGGLMDHDMPDVVAKKIQALRGKNV